MSEHNSSFSIREWDENDRPREKLMVKGKNALSDSELIAILIGSGNRDESAVALSKRILASVDHQINSLGKLSVKQLMKFKGIGEAKAIAIVAGLELGRRRKEEDDPVMYKITSSKDAYNILNPFIGDLEHEEFWVLYLNNSNKVLQKKQISIGGKTGTLVDPRIVYRYALEFGATSIILAHNHPSGSLIPSTSDKALTQKLKHAGVSLDIKLLDHLIITEKEYFSFADEVML
ncbi:JAB domain-containing protein [Aquimarina sp. BL5]|uniref:RadC family protein n=1 Tax=Aquimarina sp. BL5 TaxID=1714860 RepID=UPI000E4B8464|nr:DNA repair protein RadC [Aquimarina sp. BL5]AXT52947.1 JAB domain-containing protein [Aquimarina sp. BL5]RKN10359.1 DNA repair protein RadC [Aquimarina sp. BL5]